MLITKIELHPHGDASRKKNLAVLAIANVGGGSHVCDYIYVLKEPKPLFGEPVDRTGIILNYDRKNNAWAIVNHILNLQKDMQPTEPYAIQVQKLLIKQVDNELAQ